MLGLLVMVLMIINPATFASTSMTMMIVPFRLVMITVLLLLMMMMMLLMLMMLILIAATSATTLLYTFRLPRHRPGRFRIPMTTMIVPVHVFYPLFCALKNISILLVTVMIAMVIVMMLKLVMVMVLLMMMVVIVVMVLLLLLVPVFMIASKLFLQPLVVKILIVQSFLLPLLLFPCQTITLFFLLSEVFLPGIDVLDRRIIAGNKLIPLRMERFHRRVTARVIITGLIGSLTATTEMIAAMAIATVEASGTGRTVRIITSTDLARFDPATECLLLLWKRGGNKILRHKHKL